VSPGRGRRLAAAGALATGLSLLAAAPASAHTLSSVQPTNYRSEIVDVRPATAGLRVRLLDLGRRVELSNTGPDDVVVLGYQGEPYLRAGPGGVFENRRAPTLYLNRVQPGGSPTTLPPTADATAAPDWHRTSAGATVRWRDQRTRWEGADPPSVRRSPGTAQVIVPEWHLTLRRGDADVVVAGRILWVPSPSPLPWLAVSAVVLGVTVALSRGRRWERALSAGLAALVAVSIVRTVGLDAASGKPAAAVAVSVVATSLLPLAVWAAGTWAVGAVQARQERGVLAAGVVGFFLALFAVVDLPTLTRSQVQTAFSATFSRAALALTLGLGLGVAASSALAVRRLAFERPGPPSSPGLPGARSPSAGRTRPPPRGNGRRPARPR
jgi:lysylphosphatidylglycerol synthetase-like protein (DUF2156 family)